MTTYLNATAQQTQDQSPWITPGKNYAIVGIDFNKPVTFFYTIVDASDPKIRPISEDNFELQDFLIPTGWSFKVNPLNSSERELMLTELVTFENWYELYLNSDPQVMPIIEKLLSGITA